MKNIKLPSHNNKSVAIQCNNKISLILTDILISSKLLQYTHNKPINHNIHAAVDSIYFYSDF